MTTLPNYQKDIVDNPIQRIERVHLRRIRMSYFWRGTFFVTILAMIVPILWGGSIFFHQTLEIALTILILLNLMVIFVVEMGLMNQAAESIRREFQGKTWDLLILTGVDTWRLIIGKWMGVIRGNRRDIAFMFVLKMITIFWSMATHFLQMDGFHHQHYYNSPPQLAYLSDIRIDLTGFLIIGIIIAVYLVVEVLLVTSLPMGFSLFKFTRKNAAWLGLGLRILVPAAIGTFIHMWHYDLVYRLGYAPWWSINYTAEQSMVIFGAATALADNGYGLSALVAGRVQSQTMNVMPYILTQLAGIVTYLLWMVLMLRLAVFGAHRSNVSAPGFIPKPKPKRELKIDASNDIATQLSTASTSQPRAPQDSNLLGINNPALHRCKVVTYDDDLSQLAIRVYPMTDTKPVFSLQFTGVSFFTGAMNWDNAKFEVLGDKHLKQFADNQRLDYDTLPNNSKLYVVQSQGNRVRIIASDVRVNALQRELV